MPGRLLYCNDKIKLVEADHFILYQNRPPEMDWMSLLSAFLIMFWQKPEFVILDKLKNLILPLKVAPSSFCWLENYEWVLYSFLNQYLLIGNLCASIVNSKCFGRTFKHYWINMVNYARERKWFSGRFYFQRCT